MCLLSRKGGWILLAPGVPDFDWHTGIEFIERKGVVNDGVNDAHNFNIPDKKAAIRHLYTSWLLASWRSQELETTDTHQNMRQGLLLPLKGKVLHSPSLCVRGSVASTSVLSHCT